MNNKAVIAGAGIVMAISLVLAGRAIAQTDRLSNKIADANAQILKLQTSQNGSEDYKELLQTIESQKETINSLSADSAALVRLLAQEVDMSEEELEGMTLHELIELLISEGYLADIHEIWDDTAVVNAYKTGDESELTDERDKYVLEKVKEIIPKIIEEGMTDYEKEKAVYDWQVKYVNFDDDSLDPIPDNDEDGEVSHLPYGVLKYRSAICVGNATTFKLFMDCLDIPCMIIHSTEEGEHAWNLVQLEDDWYHVDITFDSISNGEPMYTYFNVTDSFKEEGGYPWDRDEFPAATATKYNYACMNAIDASDINEFPELLKKRLSGKSGFIYVRCLEEDADYIEMMVMAVSGHLMEGDLSTEGMVTLYDGYTLVMLEYLRYDEPDEPENPDEPEDPDEPGFDSDRLEELNKIMQKIFGYDMDDNYVYELD